MNTGSEVIAESILLESEECLAMRDLGPAIRGFDAAESSGASPDRCAAGRWMAWMLLGDFAAAWRETDAIRFRGAPDPHRFWNGEDIRGKRVIIRCLHGFGDAVQFLRYAPALQQKASEVVYEVPPRFVDLARCFDGVDHVITWDERSPRRPPAWDVQLEVMEIPYFFRTECRDLPIAERYLQLPTHIVEGVARQMGVSNTTRVGLVWSAGEWNPSRSIPFHTLGPLLQTMDCEFWNLQGADSSGVEDFPERVFLREAEGCRDSLLILAAVISHLDLVITVDTQAAHLAGALGVPAWVMLQCAADWRWMTGNTRSPWYPSLRLFRQARPGDWEGVVSHMQRALLAGPRESPAKPIAS